MKVRDAMTRDVRTIAPTGTIRQAAELMAEIDAGVLPVAENDRMVGMITDRDIAIRAIGAGKGPDTQARDVMSADVKYCYEDDDVEEICENLADQQLRRLPVVNRDKRLVGIIAQADVAASAAQVAGLVRVAAFQTAALTLLPPAITALADQHRHLVVAVDLARGVHGRGPRRRPSCPNGPSSAARSAPTSSSAPSRAPCLWRPNASRLPANFYFPFHLFIFRHIFQALGKIIHQAVFQKTKIPLLADDIMIQYRHMHDTTHLYHPVGHILVRRRWL